MLQVDVVKLWEKLKSENSDLRSCRAGFWIEMFLLQKVDIQLLKICKVSKATAGMRLDFIALLLYLACFPMDGERPEDTCAKAKAKL